MWNESFKQKVSRDFLVDAKHILSISDIIERIDVKYEHKSDWMVKFDNTSAEEKNFR